MARPDMLGRISAASILKQVPQIGAVDVDRTHLDPMLDRIADKLRRRIKTHRLAVEERAGEHIRVMAFEPARHVDEQRERCRVTLWETVRAETFDLLEAGFRKVIRIAVLSH